MIYFVISTLVQLALGVLILVVLPYLTYFNVIKFYQHRRFYDKGQECVLDVKGKYAPIPYMGSARGTSDAVKKNEEEGSNAAVIQTLYTLLTPKWAPVVMAYWTNEPWLLISDPVIVEAMYTTKNKFFNKHPMMKNLLYPMTGDSMLFAETSAEWRNRRKTIAPAFYKGKLLKMIEIARESVRFSINHLKKLVKDQNGEKTQIDLIEEVSKMNIRILLICALGEDISELKIDYWHKGKLEKRSIPFSLRETFGLLVTRLANMHVFFFPFMANWFLLPSEQDMKANAQFIRDMLEGIITRRRQAIKKDPELANAGDFLTILLTEELFKDDNERIIDECLTFFFAGSQTSSMATQNLFISLMKHPHYQDLILNELDTEVVQPHLQTCSDLKKGGEVNDLNILDLVTFENGSNLTTYINCFNEALRMQPPALVSTTVSMSETTQCGPLLIHKDDPIVIMIYQLCNNPNEWIEPEKFIPERFDPSSKYFLTPNGCKRNSFSFSPFLGGSRVCIGKTFVETFTKLTLPTLLSHFKFEFMDGVNPTEFEYPHNHVATSFTPKVDCLISDRNLTYTYQ